MNFATLQTAKMDLSDRMRSLSLVQGQVKQEIPPPAVHNHVSITENNSPIEKLTNDCLMMIADRMKIPELLPFRWTCRRFYEVTEHQFFTRVNKIRISAERYNFAVFTSWKNEEVLIRFKHIGPAAGEAKQKWMTITSMFPNVQILDFPLCQNSYDLVYLLTGWSEPLTTLFMWLRDTSNRRIFSPERFDSEIGEILSAINSLPNVNILSLSLSIFSHDFLLADMPVLAKLNKFTLYSSASDINPVICRQFGPKLNDLTLRCNINLVEFDRNLAANPIFCAQLKRFELDLPNCAHLNPTVEFACNHFVALETLVIRNSYKRFSLNDFFWQLTKLANLKRLEFYYVTGKDLLRAKRRNLPTITNIMTLEVEISQILGGFNFDFTANLLDYKSQLMDHFFSLFFAVFPVVLPQLEKIQIILPNLFDEENISQFADRLQQQFEHLQSFEFIYNNEY